MSSIETQLQYIQIIARYKYAEVFQHLRNVIETLAQKYKECIPILQSCQNSLLPDAVSLELSVVEGQLSFLIHVIGSCLAGQSSSTTASSREEQLSIDAQLVSYSIDIVQCLDARLKASTNTNPPLMWMDIAVMELFQQIRRSHIGYDGYSRGIRVIDSDYEPEIFKKISEIRGTTFSQSDSLTFMVDKM